MDRRSAAELLHLANGEIAHADGADLSLLEQPMHCLRCFFDRGLRVRPVDLVDIDVIGTKPSQRVFELALDPIPAGIAKNLAVLPFKPDLRGDDHARAQAAFSDSLANDFFRTAEPI